MPRTMSAACSRLRFPASVFPLLSIALLILASAARAGTITYSILPQPEPDTINGDPYTVDLSGTITFSGLSGTLPVTLDSSNDSGITVSSNLTMTTTDGPLSVTQSGSIALDDPDTLSGGSLVLTPTGLFVNDSTVFKLDNYVPDTSTDPLVEVLWNLANEGEYQGAGDAVSYYGNSMSFLTDDGGSYVAAGSGQWEIAAAVPEPGTLTLFGSTLMGVAVVGLRRRRFLAAHAEA